MTLSNEVSELRGVKNGSFVLKTEKLLENFANKSRKSNSISSSRIKSGKLSYNEIEMLSDKQNLINNKRCLIHKRVAHLQNECGHNSKECDFNECERYKNKTGEYGQISPPLDAFPSGKPVTCTVCRVKVSLYTKSSNPYLVMYNCNDKYSVPLLHLKISQYEVTPVGDFEIKIVRKLTARDSGNLEDSNCMLLEATSEEIRNEWLGELKTLSQEKSPGLLYPPHKKHKMTKRFLPVLSEVNEQQDSEEYSSNKDLNLTMRKSPKFNNNKYFKNSVSVKV